MSITANHTDLSELAATDQANAKEREFDKRVARGALYFLTLWAMAGVYALLAATGNAPAAPWSPIGQSQQIEQRDETPLPEHRFEVPDGYEPAVPTKPDTVTRPEVTV